MRWVTHRNLLNKYPQFSARHPFFELIIIIALSTLVKFIYVFFFTRFNDYLTTDMGGYWFRAIERFEGRDMVPNQWAIWAPCYHIILAYLFKAIYFAGLYQHKLVIVLGFNIVLSSISIYSMYRIAMKITRRRVVSLLAAGTYAIAYPYVYFNAFILSECISLPLLIMSISLLLDADWEKASGKIALVASGFLLGVAVAVRPAYGLLALPMGVYAVFANSAIFPISMQRAAMILKGIAKGALFSIGFCAIIGIAIFECHRISNGQLFGLSANGGINFFFSITRIYRVDSRSSVGHYVLIPPATVNNPENGTFVTSEPLSNQEYFYRLGMHFLKKHPERLIEKLDMFRTLFFGPLMPAMPTAAGFDVMINFSQHALFFMTVFCGLAFIPVLNRRVDICSFLLIISIPIISVITHYIFNAEQRYLYSFIFPVFIIFFLTLVAVVESFSAYKTHIITYIAAVLLCSIGYYVYHQLRAHLMRPTIKHTINQNRNSMSNLVAHRSPRPFTVSPAGFAGLNRPLGNLKRQ